ncbi:MAG TPA: tetraacyldisaccharide 4'-kinase [Burkholderiaceae bacterium]|nr:tetraacyldisaccharide 4'-kinase [Burkholderiaceae bacterium]
MQAPWRQAWESALVQAWGQRGAIAWLLWPISLVFSLLSSLRRLLYRAGILKSERVAVPVVVVGNVVAGGAGKTPVVMALVRHLQQRGLSPGVVSRGHGRSTDDGQDCREVLAESPAAQVGDEPALIKRATGAPVFVARKRADAATALLQRHPQTRVILCDDGLQHYAMKRDIEVCVFDDRGVGNGLLLPAGPLREAWPRPVDLVLHTGRHPAFAGYTAQRSLSAHAQRADGSRCALAALRGQPVTALAAIARPEAFFDMLRAQGLQLAQALALPDHYDFDSFSRPAGQAYPLVCTEKDAVKLWPRHPEAWAVALDVTLQSEFVAALDALLDAKLSSPHGHQTS